MLKKTAHPGNKSVVHLSCCTVLEWKRFCHRVPFLWEDHQTHYICIFWVFSIILWSVLYTVKVIVEHMCTHYLEGPGNYCFFASRKKERKWTNTILVKLLVHKNESRNLNSLTVVFLTSPRGVSRRLPTGGAQWVISFGALEQSWRMSPLLPLPTPSICTPEVFFPWRPCSCLNGRKGSKNLRTKKNFSL